MKKMSVKAVTVVVFAVMLGLTARQVPASGQNAIGRRIEGTWQVQVTARNCQSGIVILTVPGLHTFLPGGSMLSNPAINPALLGTGHGVWKHVGGQSFTNTVLLFRFNPDGTYAGTTKVTRSIELADNSNELTSTDRAEAVDPNGNLIETRCATVTGRRLE